MPNKPSSQDRSRLPSDDRGNLPTTNELTTSSSDEPTRVGRSGSALGQRAKGVSDPGVIEGYELEHEIHRGGQGVVYRAIQLGTKRRVALKVLLEGPFAGDSARRRFEREVELAASLRHPNIVTILDSGVSFGRYYFAMEFIDGVRLDRYIAQRRPGLDEILILLEKVCSAVNYAHQRGVIHRDLKPPNILVDPDGEPHVLDFGLAKTLYQRGSDETTVQMLSQSGQLLGTIAYMSPEQTKSAQDTDVRSDVYSLGVVFFEALAGQLPYSVDGPLAEVLNRIAETDPIHPKSLPGFLRFGRKPADELETILLRALEKDPGRRYQTSGDLGRDLRHLRLGEPIEARRASGLYMFRKLLRQYKLQASAAGLLVFVLIAFLITFAVFYKNEAVLRQQAEQSGRLAAEREAAATIAEKKASDAALEAIEKANAAKAAEAQMKQAIVQERIQAGDLARERGDLIEARDGYWDAYASGGGASAGWALRQYYQRTPDDGAAVLEFGTTGSAQPSLSPDGRKALLAESGEALTIRDLATGATDFWVRAPGEIATGFLNDDGEFAAAGRGWARLWKAPQSAPRMAVALPANIDPLGVFPIRNGEGLLVVAADRVLAFLRSAEKPIELQLQAPINGTFDFSPVTQQLAAPTAAGVILITLVDDAITAETIWTSPTPARAVRFSSEELLAVLADAVYFGTISPNNRGNWDRSRIQTPENWDLFDVRNGVDAVVLGSRAGEVALYRSGQLDHTWRITLGQLRLLRLAVDRAVVSIDERSSVTRWVPPHSKTLPLEINDAPAASWAVSNDRSTVLIAEASGRVAAFREGQSGALFSRGAGFALPGLSTAIPVPAISGNGERAAVVFGRTLWLKEATGRSRSVDWHDPLLTLSGVAISSNGALVATVAQNDFEGQQRINFWKWDLSAAGPNDRSALPLPVEGETYEFTGASIDAITFVPESKNLFVMRSNGQLLMLDPHGRRAGAASSLLAQQTPRVEPWVVLNSPARSFAFDHTGRRLAVVGRDRILSVLDVARRGQQLFRRYLGVEVASLDFSKDGELLLYSLENGETRLVELATGAQIVVSPVRPGDQPALAAWFGPRGALLLNEAAGVFEYTYARADTLITRNASYAAQRRIARLMSIGDLSAAWAETEQVNRVDPATARSIRLRILDLALRIESRTIPPEWIAAVLTDTPGWVYLRLGHAAYDGERFDQALDWLAEGIRLADGEIDAPTLWRYAQCLYLANQYDRAIEEMQRLTSRPDFDARDAAFAALLRVAGLVMGDRGDEARQAVLRITDLDPSLAASTARYVARMLAGTVSPSLMLDGLEGLARQLDPTAPNYRDDPYFFLGEMDRRRGDLPAAVLRYQQCIDLARDRWPANWSRFRLKQLARPAP